MGPPKFIAQLRLWILENLGKNISNNRRWLSREKPFRVQKEAFFQKESSCQLLKSCLLDHQIKIIWDMMFSPRNTFFAKFTCRKNGISLAKSIYEYQTLFKVNNVDQDIKS